MIKLHTTKSAATVHDVLADQNQFLLEPHHNLPLLTSDLVLKVLPG